ncbi:probable leucine-rich repeat receptor-like serine/threonine-protein kinase At3g14840 isoform X2 [Helianthus annuus]|uniref:probable leucine-rich repeat receptor-like serine/threonine-protein kinase At3g14840 isoform X2 n=1 Tax=Helianthus annuus TaxID=4232 RepID=UPI001652CCD5|nr:probable leucine-rich repeat receptor-like serine/threonine-protein kinase At3g14840 isoform X2 [Helianthus annuus]
MLLVILCVTVLPFAFASINTTCLPSKEVDALREIGRKLGKDWDFERDPCRDWEISSIGERENNVTCIAEPNSTICHVVSINLQGQSLPGILPPELVNLPYLQNLELNRNRLSGTIPPAWGFMERIVNIALLANRLNGSIPQELGNIRTLKSLSVEDNMMYGAIPHELGNLTSIERFRISGNNFSGKIPDFIGEWTSLTSLRIQASGLEGPIPSSITLSESLTDLRISDLGGPDTLCPPFSNTTRFTHLFLRSCNLIGQLPQYLASSLEVLDFSFNKLNGSIPKSFSELQDTNYIYLTGNLLSGSVPDWMLSIGNEIDLSYNNFTYNNPPMSGCHVRKTNLFASFSDDTISNKVACLGSSGCQTNWSSLYIDCGGNGLSVGNDSYESDLDDGGASFFTSTESGWGFSNTGQFLGNDVSVDNYTVKNTSRLLMDNPELYMSARVSSLSLTYYGFCLVNGSYNVSLHFAEIIFTNDGTYSSLGRRVFDIYIQGEQVAKDFDIRDEAGGVGKKIVKTYTVNVSTTLFIRLNWAGKGTTTIPSRGVYGPLISAISVKPKLNGLTGSFTLRQIKTATNNFDVANKIGEGGFGSVYKGVLSDGTLIAVKQLSSKSRQGNREFLNELGVISALQHPHLVKLHGCCIEGNQLLLAYEYMENNNLARALFGPKEWQLELDWPTRYRICIGIAKGLAFLHEESRLKIVHRDIKATNVLLDKNLNAKISDFGMAKLDEEDNTHISTRVAGTYGYMAPEYALRGYLTDKADVYSYGIVLLEIVSGASNIPDRTKENNFILLDRANFLKSTGNLMELVDPKLNSIYDIQEMVVVINLAILCTAISPINRPTMSSVVCMLEGRIVPQEFAVEQSVSVTEIDRHKMMKQLEDTNESQITEMSTRCTDSPKSAVDLYPVDAFSDYLENRPSDTNKLLS